MSNKERSIPRRIGNGFKAAGLFAEYMVHNTFITANPREFLYLYKGLGRHRANQFMYFFENGGITAISKKSEKAESNWLSNSFRMANGEGIGTGNFAGDFGEFLINPDDTDSYCLAVTRRFSIRKLPIPDPEVAREREQWAGGEVCLNLIKWKNVKVLYMSPSYFEDVKEVYESMRDETPNIIPWEKFCKKVTIVKDENQLYRHFDGFLTIGALTGRSRRNVPKED